MPVNFELMREIVEADVEALEIAEQSYGDSWKKRGGVGAFMMLARKWDRIENQVKVDKYDIFSAICRNDSKDGILDDIRDLRRYLMLVECEYLDNTQGEATQAYVGQDGKECSHIWQYTGHDHNYSIYKCNKCGAEQTR